MDSLPLILPSPFIPGVVKRPIPVRPERSEAESKDALAKLRYGHAAPGQ